MGSRVHGNEYRTTIACIDSYDDGVPTGRLYNPYLKAGEHFHSLTQYLIHMENALEAMRLPQSFTVTRSFAPPPEHRPSHPPDREPQEGKLATFAVTVLFRQNASWQGSVTWLEGGQVQSFRSVLELILLMDSVLRKPESESKKPVPASSV